MTSGKDEPRPSVPPPGAAQVGQDLLAQLHKDFVVEKKSVPAADRKVADAAKGAQLGQDLLAQFAHDFGESKRANDAQRLHELGQQLLGAVARDFGSVRPPSMNVPGTGPHGAIPANPIPVIPGAPKVPSFAPPSVTSPSASSSGSMAAPADIAPPPGYTPPMGRPVSLAAPPSAELVQAEEALAKLESAPLADDEAAEVEAMQGKGALGFFKRLFKR